MKKGERKRNPNAGFSLVELLIAMTILLIVVVPILHSFITAARTNAKSKKIMQATSTAQNIMEELKAYSLKELESTYTLTPNADGTYTIAMDNVSIGKGTYNAKVTLDPTIYQMQTPDTEKKYNDYERANIPYMDIQKDAFYVQEPASDEEAAQQFLDLYKDAGGMQAYTAEHFLDTMTRKIAIDISTTGDINTGGKTLVKISYIYTTSETAISEDKRTLVSPDESKIFDNIDYDEQLRGIYLFYNPLYSSTTTNNKDTIEINNESNLDISVYIVKQEPNDIAAAPEEQYMVKLNVIEKPPTSWLADTTFLGKTKIRTNLGKKFDNAKAELSNKQSKVAYIGNGTATSDARSRKILDYTSLDAPKVENKLYGVVIDIYEIKNGGDKYDATKKLISIDGSKEE